MRNATREGHPSRLRLAGRAHAPLQGWFMARNDRRDTLLEDDPLWYKDAIIYQLHVRAYHDSNADGIGDFAGLSQKLDYLKDLGVTVIWLDGATS